MTLCGTVPVTEKMESREKDMNFNATAGIEQAQLTDVWQLIEPALALGGEVGGDGAGMSVCVRYGKKNTDGTFAFITSHFYSVDGEMRGWWNPDGTELRRDQDERFSVENMTEFLICSDPDDLGGTEVFSDYEYDGELMPYYRNEADAQLQAHQFAEQESKTPFDSLYRWDGVSR